MDRISEINDRGGHLRRRNSSISNLAEADAAEILLGVSMLGPIVDCNVHLWDAVTVTTEAATTESPHRRRRRPGAIGAPDAAAASLSRW
jgi:hypothetical protein